MSRALVRLLLALVLAWASEGTAHADSPIAAVSYAEGFAFTNGGHGGNRLRGVGIDLLAMRDDVPWNVLGLTILSPADEADRADVRASVLRWGFGFGESPASEDEGIDPLMGYFEITFQLFHVTLETELPQTRNGLGTGIQLGIYGLLPPGGLLYYRVGARASGGHLVTTNDAFGLVWADVAIGLLLAP